MVISERKHCLARNPFGNFVTMQPCEFGYTPMKVVEMPIQQGFLLTTESSATCFDGVRFRACDTDDPTLYWAVAIRFDSPRGEVSCSSTRRHLAVSVPDQSKLCVDTKPLAPRALRRRATSPFSKCTRSALTLAKSASPRSRRGAARPQSSPTAATPVPSAGRSMVHTWFIMTAGSSTASRGMCKRAHPECSSAQREPLTFTLRFLRIKARPLQRPRPALQRLQKAGLRRVRELASAQQAASESCALISIINAQTTHICAQI